jgi:hypothetical protein
VDRRDRQNLAVAALVLTLIFGATWLMSELKRQGRIEECLMQRRKNCEQILSP